MLIGLEGAHIFYVSIFGSIEHLRCELFAAKAKKRKPGIGQGFLRQYQLALVRAAREAVVQTLVHISAPATSPFVHSGATGIFVRVFFEVRTFLPGLVHLV